MKITKRVQEIDIIAETRLLSLQEWGERMNLEKDFGRMLKLEDIYWKKRAGNNWVLQGDANTHYFHQFANGRRRKKTISFLDSDQGEIRGQGDISRHIVIFYKQLFGNSEPCSIRLNERFLPSDLKLSEEDKSNLVKPFEMEEV